VGESPYNTPGRGILTRRSQYTMVVPWRCGDSRGCGDSKDAVPGGSKCSDSPTVSFTFSAHRFSIFENCKGI